MPDAPRTTWRTAKLAVAAAIAAFVAASAHVWLRAPRADETCAGDLVPAAYQGDPAALAAMPVLRGEDYGWRHGHLELHTGGGYKVSDPTLCRDSRIDLRVIWPSPDQISIRHDRAAGVLVVATKEPAVLGAFRRVLAPRRMTGMTPRQDLQLAILLAAFLLLAVAVRRLVAASTYFLRGGVARWRRAHLVEKGWLELDGETLALRGDLHLTPGEVLVARGRAVDQRAYRDIGEVGELVGRTPAEQGYRAGRGAERVRVVDRSRAWFENLAVEAAESAATRALVAVGVVIASLAAGLVPSPWTAPPPRADEELDEVDPPRPLTVTSIAAGSAHACALLSNGHVRCWGRNVDGELGYPKLDNVGLGRTPAQAGDVDIGGEAVAISAFGGETGVVFADGTVRRWGANRILRLTDGSEVTLGRDAAPAAAFRTDVGHRILQEALSPHHTCLLHEGGGVRCWGRDSVGELGAGDARDLSAMNMELILDDIDLGGRARRIAGGASHVCAVLDDGGVRCWGDNWSGQLGLGHTRRVGAASPPARAGVVDVGGPVAEIAAGADHTCALLEGGRVRCWGIGGSGRLGYGNTGNTRDVGRERPPAAAGDVDVGGEVRHIAAGAAHTCAILAGGRLRCWGVGGNGELGYASLGNVGDERTPAQAGDVDVGAPVTQIAAGSGFTCALLEGGRVRCWGYGEHGQLGRKLEGATHTEGPPSAMPDVRVIE